MLYSVLGKTLGGKQKFGMIPWGVVNMIINSEIIDEKHKFACNKSTMEYLVYKCGIPLLSFRNGKYYFAKNDKLEECLKRMPLIIKLKSYL
jgi:hypothetical protein